VTIVGRVSAEGSPAGEHLVSVVIPIYQAEQQLPSVVADLVPLTGHVVSPDGVPFRVAEVLLVHDCGPDDSARVLREMEAQYSFVRTVWLSRNFGQHAATLAGMSSSGGDWIVTMDEDGQHDPAYIGAMLDVALAEQASVVYASPTNPAPHGRLRNAASKRAKRMVTALSGGSDASSFHSFRLILGEVGRSVAAYAGAGVYLDVALGWVAGSSATAPVTLRDEGSDRRSGYSARTLVSHFWRMVLTGGTRGLRLVSMLGLVFGLVGLLIAAFVVYRQLVHPAPTEGWASLIVVILISTGAILFSLGVIAEYVGVAVNMAMGKPLYLITQDPADGPLGRPRPRPGP
jgi:glycosyltransferase involved in cell wall biosynthesis